MQLTACGRCVTFLMVCCSPTRPYMRQVRKKLLLFVMCLLFAPDKDAGTQQIPLLRWLGGRQAFFTWISWSHVGSVGAKRWRSEVEEHFKASSCLRSSCGRKERSPAEMPGGQKSSYRGCRWINPSTWEKENMFFFLTSPTEVT